MTYKLTWMVERFLKHFQMLLPFSPRSLSEQDPVAHDYQFDEYIV